MKEKELEELKMTPIETLWIKDLDNFLEELDKYEEQEEEDRLIAEKLNKNKGGKAEKKKKRKNKNDKNKLDSSMSSINNESDTSNISNGDKKILKKKKDKDKKNKEKEKNTDSGEEKNKQGENTNNVMKNKKISKIIMEDSDEDNISVKKKGKVSNGKVTNNSDDGTSSNNDSSYADKNLFKVPLMERLKKRNVKIDEMPGFQFTGFGKKAKREFDNLSDIEFDFNDKENSFKFI